MYSCLQIPLYTFLMLYPFVSCFVIDYDQIDVILTQKSYKRDVKCVIDNRKHSEANVYRSMQTLLKIFKVANIS